MYSRTPPPPCSATMIDIATPITLWLVGIGKLLRDGVYTAAFPLHEVTVKSADERYHEFYMYMYMYVHVCFNSFIGHIQVAQPSSMSLCFCIDQKTKVL